MNSQLRTAGGILALSVAVALVRIGFPHRLEDGSINSPARIRTHCRANLMAIQDAKRAWASEHKATNDMLPENEVYRAFATPPQCPGGGTYIIGRIGQAPVCSLPTHKFSLPANPGYE